MTIATLLLIIALVLFVADTIPRLALRAAFNLIPAGLALCVAAYLLG